MLSADTITAWAVNHPWPVRDQVEQDLLLSRAICTVATDSFLSRELAFRGGTAGTRRFQANWQMQSGAAI